MSQPTLQPHEHRNSTSILPAAGDGASLADVCKLTPPSSGKRYFFAMDAEIRDLREAEVNDKSGEGVIEAVINTNDIDRYGTIVDPRGADVADFKANPIVLWCHGHDWLGTWPIGTVISLTISDSEIVAKIKFDLENEAVAAIYRLYKQKKLRGFSIGFIPHSYVVEQIEDRQIVRFTEWELVELSACSVPANPKALARDLEELGLSDDLARDFATSFAGMQVLSISGTADRTTLTDCMVRSTMHLDPASFSYGPEWTAKAAERSATTAVQPSVSAEGKTVGPAADPNPTPAAGPGAVRAAELPSETVYLGDDEHGAFTLPMSRTDAERLERLLRSLQSSNQESAAPVQAPAVDWVRGWNTNNELAATSPDNHSDMAALSNMRDSQVRHWLIHHHADGAVSWRALAACMARLCARPMDLTAAERQAAYDHLADHYAELGIVPPPLEQQSPGRAYDMALMGRQGWLDSTGNAWMYVEKRMEGERAVPIFEHVETANRQALHTPLIGRLTDHEFWGSRSLAEPQGQEALLQELATNQRTLLDIQSRTGAKFSKQTKSAIEQVAESLSDLGRELKRAGAKLVDQAGSLRNLLSTGDQSSDDDEEAERSIGDSGPAPSRGDGGQQQRKVDEPLVTREMVSKAVVEGFAAAKAERIQRTPGPRRGQRSLS